MKRRIRFTHNGIKIESFGILMLFCIAAATNSLTQESSAAPDSPKKIVETFWRMESAGGRLTPEGWNKSSVFFVRSGTSRTPNVIHVIRNSQNDSIEETARTANWAEVSVTTDEVGQIDSKLRLRETSKRGSQGVLFLRGPVITFSLVLIEKHWPLNPDGSRATEVVGSPAWLITCSDSTSWIDVGTAARYVRDLRSKATDPVVKKNAEKTLDLLRKYK